MYNYNVNHYPWEKDSDFQVSVKEAKFLFIRRFRDISVEEVTYTSKIFLTSTNL